MGYIALFYGLINTAFALACVTYFPALAILGRADEMYGSSLTFQCLAPGMGLLFPLASLQA